MTLGGALSQSAARSPDRAAIIDGAERISFRQFDRLVDALAHGLLDQGIQRGDSVALWMTNCASWVICWVACARIGAVVVPINTRYKVDEVEYILRQSDARALILMDTMWDIDYLAMARRIIPEIDGARDAVVRSPNLPQLQRVILWKDRRAQGFLCLNDLTARGETLLAQGAQLAPANPADPIIIVYTSGTTGHPKGAMHNHIILRNIANVARVMHVEAGDVVLGHMPFYHVAGAFTEAGLSILMGCTLVPLPHWIADEALDVIEQQRVNIFGGIPTHFVDCIDAIRRRPRDTSSLKSAWIGGAPVTPDVAMAAMRELKLQALQAVYGMTETTASTTFSEFDAPLGLFLQSASPRDVLARMLHNLKEIHRSSGDSMRLLRVLSRLVVLLPQAWDVRRDRGLLRADLGLAAAASCDLSAYLANAADAPDHAAVAARLAALDGADSADPGQPASQS